LRPPLGHRRQKQEILLDVGRKVQQIHYLRHAWLGNMGKPSQRIIPTCHLSLG
jgi:hypothetical protein